MPKAEFDARMPAEFWREVVDRVAAEVPGTLLLAEAFWMLEGYFVRTLGMHRVYNSAFMHMLRDENGPGYRRVIRETLEFDPEILKRYVNFMSNPDEETALEQFGKGDKYFGVAMVMATLPGPADARPRPGPGLQREVRDGVPARDARRAARCAARGQRHEREIFPLLHRRAWFAEASDFLLYDFVDRRGGGRRARPRLLERGRRRTLARPLPRPVRLDERIRSASRPIRSPDRLGRQAPVRRSLAEGLGLPDDPTAFVAFRDARTGLESPAVLPRALGARAAR